jgi:hypothetical protein
MLLMDFALDDWPFRLAAVTTTTQRAIPWGYFGYFLPGRRLCFCLKIKAHRSHQRAYGKDCGPNSQQVPVCAILSQTGRNNHQSDHGNHGTKSHHPIACL